MRNRVQSFLGYALGWTLLSRRQPAHTAAVPDRAHTAPVKDWRPKVEHVDGTEAVHTDRSLVGIVKSTVSGFMADDCMTMGAALAYYTVFSLAPLLLTVISVAGLALGRESVQREVQNQISSLIGSGAATQVQQMLSNATANHTSGIIGTVVGLIVLLFGATGTFGSLQDALNRVWHVKPDPKAGGIKAFLTKRLLSFGMLLGVAFLLLVSLALSAALGAAGKWMGGILPGGFSTSLLHWVNIALSLLVITMLFAAIFRVLPDAHIPWRGVWIGSAVTSVLFTIGKTAIGLYLGKSATASAYGAAGSFVLIVLWLNYASLILLLGAEFTKTWAAAHGEHATPQEGAMHVKKEEHPVRA